MKYFCIFGFYTFSAIHGYKVYNFWTYKYFLCFKLLLNGFLNNRKYANSTYEILLQNIVLLNFVNPTISYLSKSELRMIYYGFYKLDLFSEIKNEYLITKEYFRNIPFRIRSDQSVESAITR